MKRVELIRKVRRAANAAGKDIALVRDRGAHEVWACGRTRVTLPRHREVNDRTAGHILRELEPELGEDWWAR